MTTNSPKGITLGEMAEGDYCILNSIYESTIKAIVINNKPKIGSKYPEASKFTVGEDTAEGDLSIIKRLLRATHKPEDDSEYLKNLLEKFRRMKDGQVMEGIWNSSNLFVYIVTCISVVLNSFKTLEDLEIFFDSLVPWEKTAQKIVVGFD